VPTEPQPLAPEQISLLSRRFWGAHLLTIVAVAASIALATWQFDVWQASRRAAEHDLSGLAPIALTNVFLQGQAFPGNDIGRPVTLTGQWMPSETFFVQGVRAPHGSGAPGYWAVTPVLIGKSAIPVLRGWVPTASAPTVAATSVAISGWLEPSDDTNPVEIRRGVFGSLSLAAVTQVISTPLYSGYVVVKSADSGVDGVQTLGPTQTSTTGADFGTGLRNFLYGVQWWLFAGLAVYLWWRWCRDQRHPPTTEQVASTSS
jgi:cytochrome oxidase assembly protein ShyY1